MKNLKNNSLKERKFKHYILYAFGEIFLIIAGILIAVNINNWNEKRAFLKKANSYIADVKKDLEIDTSYFGNAVKRIELKIDYKKRLLNQDSIANYSTRTIQGILSTGTNNITINKGAFEKIVESGILTLPEKKFLFEKLDNYYSNYINYLNEFNKWEENSVKKDMDFWVYQDNYDLEYFDSLYPTHKSESNRKKLMKVLNSSKGRNYIHMGILREETMKEIYAKTKDIAKKLIGRIDSIQGQEPQ